MFVLGNLVNALASLLGMVIWVYTWILIGRAVISWVNPDPYNPIVRFLYSATEPVLRRLRRVIPTVAGGIDFSPMILLLALFFLQEFLVQSLHDLARTLR
jgi:YggT family protein